MLLGVRERFMMRSETRKDKSKSELESYERSALVVPRPQTTSKTITISLISYYSEKLQIDF